MNKMTPETVKTVPIAVFRAHPLLWAVYVRSREDQEAEAQQLLARFHTQYAGCDQPRDVHFIRVAHLRWTGMQSEVAYQDRLPSPTPAVPRTKPAGTWDKQKVVTNYQPPATVGKGGEEKED